MLIYVINFKILIEGRSKKDTHISRYYEFPFKL